jgi:hypothetical protein
MDIFHTTALELSISLSMPVSRVSHLSAVLQSHFMLSSQGITSKSYDLLGDALFELHLSHEMHTSNSY